MSGSCTSTASFGFPDIGLLTMSEMVESAKHIVNSISIPVIADADTGYGNAINVMRTIKEFESVGVSGIHIEDQISPKKCGHMQVKQLITCQEMVGKIKAAIKARKNDKFLIIARTDARSVYGLDDAIYRANEFIKAGADMIFGEALQDRRELKIFADNVDAPLFTDQTEQGKSPIVNCKELEELGYKLVIFSTAALRASVTAVKNIFSEIILTGTQEKLINDIATRKEIYNLAELEKYNRLENKFLPKKENNN
jgi:methylisocitrate lyase